MGRTAGVIEMLESEWARQAARPHPQPECLHERVESIGRITQRARHVGREGLSPHEPRPFPPEGLALGAQATRVGSELSEDGGEARDRSLVESDGESVPIEQQAFEGLRRRVAGDCSSWVLACDCGSEVRPGMLATFVGVNSECAPCVGGQPAWGMVVGYEATRPAAQVGRPASRPAA